MGCGASTQQPPLALVDESFERPAETSARVAVAAATVPTESVALKTDPAAATQDWDDWDDDGDEDNTMTTRTPGEATTVVQPSPFAGTRGEGDGHTYLCGSGKGLQEPTVPLACSHCGHPCSRFPHSRWAASADYFHMRNYAPDARMPQRLQEDLAKLCTLLEPDDEAAAFACGCSWQTVIGEKQLAVLARAGTPAPPHGGARLPSDDQVLWWGATSSA